MHLSNILCTHAMDCMHTHLNDAHLYDDVSLTSFTQFYQQDENPPIM